MMTTKGEKAVTSQSAESLIFQTLAEESPHGILVFQDDKVTFANASASLMLGYSLRTISRWTRKKLVSRVTEEDRPKMLWVFSKLAEGRGPPVQSEIRFIQKKGKTRWFHTIGNIVILDDQPTLQINFLLTKLSL